MHFKATVEVGRGLSLLTVLEVGLVLGGLVPVGVGILALALLIRVIEAVMALILLDHR